MNRLVLLILLAVTLSTGTALAQSCDLGGDKPLTVMTYNIRVGYGSERDGTNPLMLSFLPKSMDPILAAIREINPDVLALQEVMGPGQVNAIGKELGMHVVMGYHPSLVRWWGVALLSRCPVYDAAQFQTSRGMGNARTTLRATFGFGPEKVDFIVYHRDPDVNDGSQGRMLEKIAEDSANPVVILGDFNLKADAKRMMGILSRFDDTGALLDTAEAERARSLGTISHGKSRRIDFVLTEKGKFKTVATGLTAAQYDRASDHRGYYARLLFAR